jgi:hypothetical protein
MLLLLLLLLLVLAGDFDRFLRRLFVSGVSLFWETAVLVAAA